MYIEESEKNIEFEVVTSFYLVVRNNGVRGELQWKRIGDTTNNNIDWDRRKSTKNGGRGLE